MFDYKRNTFLNEKIIDETPRLPLMKLQRGKEVDDSIIDDDQPFSTLENDKEFYETMETSKLTKAVFKKLEMAKIDVPCDSEDEDEDPKTEDNFQGKNDIKNEFPKEDEKSKDDNNNKSRENQNRSKKVLDRKSVV